MKLSRALAWAAFACWATFVVISYAWKLEAARCRGELQFSISHNGAHLECIAP